MKIKISKSELRKQGYKKTSVFGLYVHANKGFYNYETQNVLKPTKRGCVTINKVAYNGAKLLLQAFYNIEPRNGQITCLDSNKANLKLDNVKYTTEIRQSAPKYDDIKRFLNLYIYFNRKISLNNIIIKLYIKTIADKRAFFETSDFEKEVFKEWLIIKVEKTSYYILSKKYNTATENIKTAIFKCLHKLIQDSFTDEANGILQPVEKPKKMTKASELKKFNSLIKELKENELKNG